MKIQATIVGLVGARQTCRNPICEELTKGATTITRENEMTIACEVPEDFHPEEVFIGYKRINKNHGTTEFVRIKIDYDNHRKIRTNTGVFAFFEETDDEKFLQIQGSGEVGIYANTKDCKIGEARVVDLDDLKFYDFAQRAGSSYKIEKNGDLVITKQLNRNLGGDKLVAWNKTMENWMDHFVFYLSDKRHDEKDHKEHSEDQEHDEEHDGEHTYHGKHNDDEENEYYFSENYEKFYCHGKYKESPVCEKGKVLPKQDLKTQVHSGKLFYRIRIPDSGNRAPSMYFSMLFGPPMGHEGHKHKTTYIVSSSEILFRWPLRTKLLIVILILIFLSGGVLVAIFIKRFLNKQIEKGIDKAETERLKLLSDDRPQEAFEHIMSCMQDPKKEILKKIYINPSKIERDGNELGKGAFGTTHAGRLKNDTGVTIHKIAIKTMKSTVGNGVKGPAYSGDKSTSLGSNKYASGDSGIESCEYFDAEHAKAIFDEAIQMNNFEHNNVMKLIGVSFNDFAEPEMILPLMDCGDLRNYVKNDENVLLISDCLKFCQQAAEGMNYLVHQGVIHRDLAARNCLLEIMDNNRINLRIADFGLSKTFEKLYQEEYVSRSQTKLPLKWLAIEVLQRRMFSEKSDVWAFGILTWEIFTRGAVPYGPLGDWAGLKDYLLKGDRLEMPSDCSLELCELMMECWHDEPEKRPTFAILVGRIDQFVKGNREAETKKGRKSNLPRKESISFKPDHFSRAKADYKSNRGRKMSPPIPAPRKPLPAVPPRDTSLSPTFVEELV